MVPFIYIIDLPHAVQNSIVSKFYRADDTSLHYQALNINIFNRGINNDLMQLESWFNGNKLSFDAAKTNPMLGSTKQKYNILKSNDEL